MEAAVLHSWFPCTSIHRRARTAGKDKLEDTEEKHCHRLPAVTLPYIPVILLSLSLLAHCRGHGKVTKLRHGGIHGPVHLTLRNTVVKELEIKSAFKLRCIIAVSATFCGNGRNENFSSMEGCMGG